MLNLTQHPAFAAIMTLIVAQQWLSLGMLIPDGSTGMLTLHLVLAPIATAAVIMYHYSSRKSAYYDGKVDGIGDALNPTRWRPHVEA